MNLDEFEIFSLFLSLKKKNVYDLRVLRARESYGRRRLLQLLFIRVFEPRNRTLRRFSHNFYN